MHKLKALFSKDGDMIYISHLDLLRLFQRALRRAKLPFSLSQGFSPHPKLSVRKALALGKLSPNEEIIFYLNERIKESEFIDSLNKELPKGVLIKDAFYEG